MPNGFRFLKGRALPVAVGLSLYSTGLGVIAQAADTLFFQDGHPIKGTIHRLTGDLIEIKTISKPFQPEMPYIVRRRELQSRLDSLITRDKRTYSGEVFFVDQHNIEMLTTAGITVQIPRDKIKKLSLGVSDATVTTPTQSPTASTNPPPESPQTTGNSRLPMSDDSHTIPVYSDRATPSTPDMHPAITAPGAENGNP